MFFDEDMANTGAADGGAMNDGMGGDNAGDATTDNGDQGGDNMPA